MRGLSLIGLLVGLGLVGVLVFNQLKPSSQTGETLPTEAIDQAEEAAETVEQSTETKRAIERVEQIETLEQDLENPPED